MSGESYPESLFHQSSPHIKTPHFPGEIKGSSLPRVFFLHFFLDCKGLFCFGWCSKLLLLHQKYVRHFAKNYFWNLPCHCFAFTTRCKKVTILFRVLANFTKSFLPGSQSWLPDSFFFKDFFTKIHNILFLSSGKQTCKIHVKLERIN